MLNIYANAISTLASPLGVSDATEARSVLATARDWAVLPVTASTHWYRDALAYGCPTGSTDEEGLTTYVGGCTTPDGRTYAGRGYCSCAADTVAISEQGPNPRPDLVHRALRVRARWDRGEAGELGEIGDR